MQSPRLSDGDARDSIGAAPAVGGLPDTDVDNDAYERAEASALHVVKMIALIVVPIIAAACVLIYIFHVTMPHCWRWLDEEDLSLLRSMCVSVLSGVISSLAVGYFFTKRGR